MDLTRLPALQPQTPASAPPSRDVRAAQRAFFQAAMGKAAEPAPAAVTAAATAPAAASSPVASAPAQAAPDRILRPGSLVDIRV